MKRSKELGLCPQRVWTLAAGAPGRELALTVLIPPVSQTSPIWQQDGHSSCTPDLCVQSSLDFTRMEQLHLCDSPHTSCYKTTDLFPQDILVRAIELQRANTENYIPTAWALDGKSIIKPGQRFMAISHVWSDGTGNGTWKQGVVNVCLWDHFCTLARMLDCVGIWWDAITLPQDKGARIQAINTMDKHYSNAHVTLVHDRYLSTSQWLGSAQACFAIIMSSWFTRGWTALELAISSKHSIKVLFDNHGQPVLKDLEEEILDNKGDISYAFHQLSSSIIRSLRDCPKGFDNLLTALGSR
ncbi:hypothetical protein DFP73DRAFT_487776, partial [Morchella snyderi]